MWSLGSRRWRSWSDSLGTSGRGLNLRHELIVHSPVQGVTATVWKVLGSKSFIFLLIHFCSFFLLFRLPKRVYRSAFRCTHSILGATCYVSGGYPQRGLGVPAAFLESHAA